MYYYCPKKSFKIKYISNNTINPIKGFMNSPPLKYRHLYNRGK